VTRVASARLGKNKRAVDGITLRLSVTRNVFKLAAAPARVPDVLSAMISLAFPCFCILIRVIPIVPSRVRFDADTVFRNFGINASAIEA